ncbi:MAG: hypothetical protein Q9208_003026 [Pyrenodesmia sp. 3 TL-2023]
MPYKASKCKTSNENEVLIGGEAFTYQELYRLAIAKESVQYGDHYLLGLPLARDWNKKRKPDRRRCGASYINNQRTRKLPHGPGRTASQPILEGLKKKSSRMSDREWEIALHEWQDQLEKKVQSGCSPEKAVRDLQWFSEDVVIE